jgi:hypothetical protein
MSISTRPSDFGVRRALERRFGCSGVIIQLIRI